MGCNCTSKDTNMGIQPKPNHTPVEDKHKKPQVSKHPTDVRKVNVRIIKPPKKSEP